MAVLVSAGLLLLLVSGIQGSGQRSSVGGFECADATIRGTYGIQMHGTGPRSTTRWREPDLDRGGEAHL